MRNTVRIMVDTRYVTTPKVPAADLDRVRHEAIRNGYNDADASAVRFAIVELAKQLRERDRKEQAASPAA
jgi:hypothetical protein